MTAEPDYRARHILNVVRDFTKAFPELETIKVDYGHDPKSDTIWVYVLTSDGKSLNYYYDPGDYDPAIYTITLPREGVPDEVMVDISNEGPNEL